MKALACLLAVAALALACPAWARIKVHATGAVAQPGTLALKDAARLSDAALAARVQPDAYLLGAAWLRPSRLTAQARLKAGILYDLGALHRAALARGDLPRAREVGALRKWLAGLPVTGREAALLAPRVVEATPSEDWPVAPGDTLFYPVRPTTVRVVGALAHPCTLPFRPLQSAPDYLAACTRNALADRDWAWVIQPDGRTFRRGVAAWNRAAPLPLAPGAVLYVPIDNGTAARIDADLNREIAAFLATQTLPGPAR